MPKGRKPVTRQAEPRKPSLLRFRPRSWYSHIDVGDYVVHLLMELGRLGLGIHDIESHERAPHTQTVLSDTVNWMANRSNPGYEQLYGWPHLDFGTLSDRAKSRQSLKPRIEIAARITKMNNLSVLWYPAGWHDAALRFGSGDRSGNLIPCRTWKKPVDFRWFTGDETPSFDSRPSNELMYLRGVGSLRPEKRAEHGYYARFNRDVVDSVLICIARAAYEGLLTDLRANFEVTALDSFDFTIEEEDDDDASSWSVPVSRVVAWSLEDTKALTKRRQQAEREAECRAASDELTRAQKELGISVEVVVGAISQYLAGKPGETLPTMDTIDKNAAKLLRQAGHVIDAPDVRRIRKATEICRSVILPERLRKQMKETLAGEQTNVVDFRNNQR